MSKVEVKKADSGKNALAFFEEVGRRFQAVQKRAFELFEKRGRQPGQDLEDWLKAERELFGWPAAELTEKNGVYQMQITLPGFEAKDVEVTAAPTEIIVRANTQEEKKTKEGEVLWTEFGSNDVYRRFETPNPINADEVTAKLENGVLRINAPRIAKPKELTAKAA